MYRTEHQRAGFIKVSCAGWIMDAIGKQAKRRGLGPVTPRINMGLTNPVLDEWVRAGQDFIYLDHSYFRRGWANNMFRAVRNACHLAQCKPRPDDRLKRFGVQIEPWRRERGSKIVIIPTYAGHERIWPETREWAHNVEQKLRGLTDRPIVVKSQKGDLRGYLADAWAVVCNQSVAGVEAALMGVPVFSTPRCCSWPVSNPIERIENPEFPDRHDWATGLSYASWHTDEIDEVDWIDYDYSLCDDLPSGGARAVRAPVLAGMETLPE